MRKLMVVAAALVLVAAGCGDGTAPDEGETLQDFLGMPNVDDPDAMQAQFEDEQRQVEEYVAECMAAEGFDYEPRDVAGGVAVAHPRAEMDQDEFVAEYGYGLTTIDQEDQMVDEPVADPNQEVLEAMDDAEREAWQEALHGEMPESDPDADPDEPVTDLGEGGCIAEAQDEVRGAQRSLHQELGDELQAMLERVQADPRIVEAQQGWSACMRDAGWEFNEMHEASAHIMEQANELRGMPGPGDVAEVPAEPEEGGEPPEDFEPPAPPEPDADEWAALQEEELELAAVDYECQVEHFGEEYALFQEVQEEYEREFVEEHRDVLEDLRED